MRIPGRDFRARMAGKTMWAISVFSGDDAAEAAPLFVCLRLSADYMKIRWGGKVLARAIVPATYWPIIEASLRHVNSSPEMRGSAPHVRATGPWPVAATYRPSKGSRP